MLNINSNNNVRNPLQLFLWYHVWFLSLFRIYLLIPKLWGDWGKDIKNRNKTPKPFQAKPHNLGLGIFSGLEPVRVFSLVHKKLTSSCGLPGAATIRLLL